MNWQTLITIGHIIGTVLGVGGATFAEIFSRRTLKGDVFQGAGISYLKTTYTAMRVGLILLVVSGFGYLLLLRFEAETQYIYSPRVWAKMAIILIILINAILMQIRYIPLGLGSSISLTSWYAALVLGAWRTHASFAAIIAVYVLAIIVVAFFKELIFKPKDQKI